MTRHVLVAALGLWLVAGAAPHTQTTPAGDVAELDVWVDDNKGGPVLDLKAEEFQILDDGKKVDVKSVESVMADGRTKQTGRILAIVLDDAGVQANGTGALQTVANLFAANMGPNDTVSVTALHGQWDEQTSMQLALSRIAGFTAGSRPYVRDQTPQDLFILYTKMAKRWQETEIGRRKAVVCIGSEAVCAIPEPSDANSQGDLFPRWVEAIREMGRAHVSAFAAIPAPVPIHEGSVNDLSGGGTFNANSNFTPAVEAVVRSLNQYYLIKYVEPKSSKKVRSIRVSTTRKNMTVKVRQRR